MKVNNLLKQKHEYLIHTVVNRVLPSLHGSVTCNYAYSPYNMKKKNLSEKNIMIKLSDARVKGLKMLEFKQLKFSPAG